MTRRCGRAPLRSAAPVRAHADDRTTVGAPHAGKTADVTIATDTYRITVDDGSTITAPRKASRDIKRHKAAAYQA